MALINITADKYLIFITGSTIRYNHNTTGQVTTYCDDCWTVEEFDNELAWIERLAELGIILE